MLPLACGLSFLLSTLLAAGVCSGQAEPPAFSPTAIDPGDSPVVDGLLADEVWKRCAPIADFLQRTPREGATPSEATEVRMVYSPTDLYLGIRCWDSHPDGIVATVMRRDDWGILQNDQLVVSIDSYSDNRNGYFFSTNPLGVRVDAQFFDEGDRFVDAWDGRWDVAAHVDGEGWTAEYRIPFSTLPFRRGRENEMGINLFRRMIRTSEEVYSPLIPLRFPSGTPTVSQARKVTFREIRGADRWWVEPYFLARGVESDLTGPTSREVDVGGELRWAATQSVTASLSVNTDFAQVESDDRQINLSQYALFIPEKRDFFLENGGLFSFGVPSELEVFFSRRIGLAGIGVGAQTVPIHVGGKLSGQVGRAETGVLYARTGAAGEQPGEDFVAARAKVEVARRSYVGGIVTRRSADDAFGNGSLGIDTLIRFPWDLAFTGLTAATTNGDGAFDSSFAHRARVERTGEQAGFHLEYVDLGSDFDPAVGFVRRPGTKSSKAGARLPWYPRESRMRRVMPFYEYEQFADRSGAIQSERHGVALDAEFRSTDFVGLLFDAERERVVDEFRLLGRVLVPAGTYETRRVGALVQTKTGRPLNVRLTGSAGDFFGGDRTTLTAGLQWKANRHLTLAADFESSHVTVPGGDVTARIAQLRTDYSLNVASSFSMFLQYDNASDELGVRLQARHIFREGTEVLLVYTGGFEEGGRLDRLFQDPAHQALILKATFGFQL